LIERRYSQPAPNRVNATEPDRLGRNLADLVRLIADLEHGKINFESLTEKIQTGSPAVASSSTSLRLLPSSSAI
jgi:DNA invertase Pin-like site-specific DNA recombinase